MALLRKVFLLIPLIFILPGFFADKAFAVFLAEPISDFIAAAVTTFMFFRFFIRMLKEGNDPMISASGRLFPEALIYLPSHILEQGRGNVLLLICGINLCQKLAYYGIYHTFD